MAKQAKGVVLINDFQGLVTNIDRDDLRSGAASNQVNLSLVRIGEMKCRAGYLPVRFEDDDN